MAGNLFGIHVCEENVKQGASNHQIFDSFFPPLPSFSPSSLSLLLSPLVYAVGPFLQRGYFCLVLVDALKTEMCEKHVKQHFSCSVFAVEISSAQRRALQAQLVTSGWPLGLFGHSTCCYHHIVLMI